MPKFSPFRVSFDGPLGTRERTRARVAATVLSGSAIFLGVTGLLALLNASSSAVGDWANGSIPQDVRVVGGEGAGSAGKPCEDQTWPYIEPRCLKAADTKFTKRSTPKHGLGSQQIAQPSGPVAPSLQAASKPQTEVATTGSAVPAAPASPAAVAASAPALQAVAPAAPDRSAAAQSSTSSQQHNANTRLSKREQLAREERLRQQRVRRAEALRMREDVRRARAEAWDGNPRDGVARRWSGFADENSLGGSRRAVANRRGAFEDDLFGARR